MSPDLRPSAPDSDDVLVRVSGVSKKFCRSLKKSLWYGVQDMVREINPFQKAESGKQKAEINSAEGQDKFQLSQSQLSTFPGDQFQISKFPISTLRDDEFWAVHDVSFELKRGECLGLIGRNGAGKTTLLKMLNGLIKPDHGRIEMRGKVGALIALGAGFNPILSGRENVYVNAAVLGLGKKDIEEKIEEIIEFAEIGEFIDAPVQSYSSGMQVRLGFAVATALNPDVLILDEVLAVGDASFRHKCYHRINKLIKKSAVILVSHSMDYVATLSTAVGMMQRGNFRRYANVVEGIAAYEEANKSKPTAESDGGKVFVFYPPITSAEVRIVKPDVAYGEALEVRVDLHCAETVRNAEIRFSAVNQSEQHVMACCSDRLHREIDLPSGPSVLKFKIDPLHLHDGHYRWNFSIIPTGTIEHLVWATRAGEFTVRSPSKGLSNIPYLPPLSSFEVLS